MSSGKVTSHWEGTINGWLHVNSAPASLKAQSGVSITSSTPIIMNQYMSGSYVVVNNGDSNFNLRSLGLFGQDPNGNQFFIDRDNSGSDIYVGAHSTRTFNGKVYNFAYNCPNCTNGGNYQIIGEYQDPGSDNNAWHQLGTVSGGANPIFTNVSSLSAGHLAIDSGLTNTPSSNVQIGKPLSVTFHFSNNGGQAFTFNGVHLVLTELSNNYTQVLQSWGGGTYSVGTGETLTYSTQNLLSGCVSCLSGTYMITAQYQDTNNVWNTMDRTSSGVNAEQFNVTNTSVGVGSTYDPQSGYNVLYKRGSDGNIYENDNKPNIGWSNWYLLGAEQHPSNTYFVGTPTPIINPSDSNNPVVMAVDQNGNTWSVRRNGTWGSWSSQGGNVSENIAGVYYANNTMPIFYMVGTDGKVYENDDHTSWWSGWSQRDTNPSGVNFAGTPSVSLDNSGNIVVEVRDTTGAVWIDQIQSGAWSGWQSLGSLHMNTGFDNNISQLAFPAGGTVISFAIGTGGQVFENDNHGSWQSGWSLRDSVPNGVTFTGTPTATMSPDGQPEAIARDTSGNVWYDGMNTSYQWQGWQSESGAMSIQGDSAILNFSSQGIIGLYATGSDGAVWESNQHAASPYITVTNWWTRNATP